jgi:hypothetical protein
VDWIRLAQDRYKQRAVVNAVMNLRVLAPRSLFVLWSDHETFTLRFCNERLSNKISLYTHTNTHQICAISGIYLAMD